MGLGMEFSQLGGVIPIPMVLSWDLGFIGFRVVFGKEREGFERQVWLLAQFFGALFFLGLSKEIRNLYPITSLRNVFPSSLLSSSKYLALLALKKFPLQLALKLTLRRSDKCHNVPQQSAKSAGLGLRSFICCLAELMWEQAPLHLLVSFPPGNSANWFV